MFVFWDLACCFFLLLFLFLVCFDVEINPGTDCFTSLNLGHLSVRSLNVVDKFGEIASFISNEGLIFFCSQ